MGRFSAMPQWLNLKDLICAQGNRPAEDKERKERNVMARTENSSLHSIKLPYSQSMYTIVREDEVNIIRQTVLVEQESCCVTS